MTKSVLDQEHQFLCLDRLFRWVAGTVEHRVSMWELIDVLGFDAVYTEALIGALQRKRLLAYVLPEGELRLTQLGIAIVLNAHDRPDEASAYFPPLNQFESPVNMLILDGSLPADNLREMTVQLDGMIAALEGSWKDRIDLTPLIDELDLRLWKCNDYPYFALDDLSEIADILASYHGR